MFLQSKAMLVVVQIPDFIHSSLIQDITHPEHILFLHSETT